MFCIFILFFYLNVCIEFCDESHLRATLYTFTLGKRRHQSVLFNSWSRLYKGVSFDSWLAFNMYLSLWKSVCIINNISIVPYTIDYTTFAASEKVGTL